MKYDDLPPPIKCDETGHEWQIVPTAEGRPRARSAIVAA